VAARKPRLVKLSTRVATLTESVRDGLPVPAGRLYGLPELADGDIWVDIAGATALTAMAPRTITGWLARGGPRRNPFPQPDRIMYRLYWPRSEIESWRAREQGNRTAAVVSGRWS
jgi:predicted DNA-binding transcriptional regulator AlpA